MLQLNNRNRRVQAPPYSYTCRTIHFPTPNQTFYQDPNETPVGGHEDVHWGFSCLRIDTVFLHESIP